MAVHAIRGHRGKLIVGVAGSARDRFVSTRQREFCNVVRERRLCPRRCRVTGRAGHRESRLDMVRIRCRREGALMTAVTIGRGCFERSALVARYTFDGFVAPRQREGREVVVEAGLPAHGIDSVTLCAVR